MKSSTQPLPFICGLLIGVVASLLIGVMILKQHQAMVIRNAIPTATNTPSITATSTTTSVPPTATLTPPPPKTTTDLIKDAERAMNKGNFEAARAILVPLTGEEQTTANYADIYADLGDIEYNEGHYRMACGYYKRQIAYEYTLEVLLTNAVTCEAGGVYDYALKCFQDIYDWPGTEADEYRDAALAEIEWIKAVKGY
jgi:hypothetical protein